MAAEIEFPGKPSSVQLKWQNSVTAELEKSVAKASTSLPRKLSKTKQNSTETAQDIQDEFSGQTCNIFSDK